MSSATPRIDIVCFTGASGITHYSISLARELARNATVTLIAGRDYARQGYPDGNFSALPFFNRSRWYPLDVLRLLLVLFKRKPDLVLFQSTLKFAFVETLLVRLLGLVGIETAITIHDLLPHYPQLWSRWTHAALYRSFDKVIVHSQRTLRDLRNLQVELPALVVPHGLYDLFITHPPDRNTARSRLTQFAPSDCVILFFGKIDARKGIGLFLELREQLANDCSFRYVIAGRAGVGPDQMQLFAAIEDARQAEDCVVHDHNIPFGDVQDYFALADIVVLPYQEGTTSGVLKLALAFRKPVVATDVGDIGETVTPETGIVVSSNNSASAMAEAVRHVRLNYGRYSAGCGDAQERFGWSRIGEEYARFLLLRAGDSLVAATED